MTTKSEASRSLGKCLANLQSASTPPASSVHLPIVMVDNALTVRRATPTAYQAFNISDIDIGRRITELNPNIEVGNLEKLLREGIETLTVREREVRHHHS